MGNPVERATPATGTNAPRACETAGGGRSDAFTRITGLIVGEGACAAILASRGELARDIPEIAAMDGCPQNTPYHIYDVLGHTAHVVEASPATPTSRWAALLHDSGKPLVRRVDGRGRDHFLGHAEAGARIARDVLVRLEAPQELVEDVCTLVRLHEWFVADADEAVRAALETLDGRAGLYRALLALQVADSTAKAPEASGRVEAALRTRARLERILENA